MCIYIYTYIHIHMFVLINTQQKPNEMLLLPKCVAMRCFFVAMRLR